MIMTMEGTALVSTILLDNGLRIIICRLGVVDLVEKSTFPTLGSQWQFKCVAHCKFFFCCECFLFGYFNFYGRIKSYAGLKYLFLKSCDFWWFFHDFVLEFVSCARPNIMRTLQPPSPHLNARRYFGRMLSCRRFDYFPAWEYCGGFSFSFELKRRASFIP